MKSDVKSFYIILTIKIMLMNVLLNMRMFGLFSETSQEVTNNEMQEACTFCMNSFLSAFFPLPVKRYCFK